MKFLAFYLLFITSLFSLECQKRFTLNTQNQLTSLEILEEFAQDCELSIIYLDSLAHEILASNKPKLSTQHLSATDFLNLLLEEANLHFEIQNKILKLAFLYPQTYEINYISTSRVGSSSTDVVLSPNTTTQEVYLTPNQDHIAQKTLTLGSTQSSGNSGRSGTKIFSIDENNFWGEIETEITQIAYHPEDKLISKIPKSITINKNAGLITVTANALQHKRITTYLKHLHSKMHAQVLIDVHILMIRHDQGKTTGINWNDFYHLGNLIIPSPSSNGGSSFLQFGKNGINMELNILSQGVSFNRIIEFLETYGTTRSISNPKILTLNNQPAIISVGSVLRYIQNSVYQSSSQGSNIQNSVETYPSIFSGVLLDVTPSIQGDEIILKINPSITRTKNASLENEPNALKTPPNLSTNQLSSIVKVKSGEKIVLGGLISETQNKKEFKIPLLGDIPLLNYLFKYRWNQDFNEEMVIIISPTIIQTTPQTEQHFQAEFKALLQAVKILSLKPSHNASSK